MSTTESMWFNIIVIIVAAATIGVSIANIVYYNRIRTGTCGEISHSEAVTMLWINAGLIVLAAVIFLWAIWRLVAPAIRPKPKAPEMQPTHYAVQSSETPPVTTHHVFLPSGPVTGEATSTAASAITVVPGEITQMKRSELYE